MEILAVVSSRQPFPVPSLSALVAMCSNSFVMTLPVDPATRLHRESAARLRAIPSVDELLARPNLIALAEKSGRAFVTDAVRATLAELRDRLKNDPASFVSEAAIIDSLEPAALEERIKQRVEALLAPSLVRVINATGVILHTNLGRAPLSTEAAVQIAATATGYSNLEYDILSGERGTRDVHTASLLAQLVGSESAIVVNNNAAAVFLVLNTLAKGAEVIVSRGELIEIGDGFRIPDIMSESGAILREVGTTNRTRIRDYERAFNERTRLLLRVHPSNFRITGFTERPTLEEITALGRRLQVPAYEDLGSGCLADLTASGISEPAARESCEAGVDVLTFSGDKLLGGPQAGVIAGKREFVERIRRNPLFRALRVDKLTIAALEITLNAYLRSATNEIPALRMIQMLPSEIAHRAQEFASKLRDSLDKHAEIATHPGYSVVGGGSTPDQQLPTRLISIASQHHSSAVFEERLRKPANGSPVIARIEGDRVLLDLRTVFHSEEPILLMAIGAACR